MAKFNIDLNVLNHLGLSLYTNTPAVLTEIVSNAWDADATEVHIDIDKDKSTIVIADNGHGMNEDDVEHKFLNVGYARRQDNRGESPKFKRKVMGRKGIGKLAMFSLANEVSVYTKKKDGNVVALKVNVSELKKAIEEKCDYDTETIEDTASFTSEQGTTIVLSDIDRDIKATATYLKKHLARRFSVLGDKYQFKVFVKNDEITLSHREYTSKLEFVWSFGNSAEHFKQSVKQYKELENKIIFDNKEFEISGFIASVSKPSELKDDDVSNNAITILANGRIFQENILDELENAKVFARYLVGEINADFLDLTEYQDMAISSRQGLRQNDERYAILKGFLAKALKGVDRDWDDWRREEGLKEIKAKSPVLQQWLDNLSKGNKAAAEKLLSKVNTCHFSGSDEEQEDSRKSVLKSAVLAFEKLKVKDNLDELEQLSSFSPELFKPILQSIDDIEESYFYDVTQQRLSIIQKLEDLKTNNEAEKVIQQYLYEHLWLLDPAWERTTETYFEQELSKELKQACPDNDSGARLDIAYKNIAGKHIIIEMKKEMPSYQIDIYDLIKQGNKYIDATKQWYLNHNKQSDILGVEVYFLVGSKLKSKIYQSTDKERVNGLLRESQAILLTYDELITGSKNSYSEYLKRKNEVQKIKNLIDNI
ncbi:ATP-binding protein [Mannheimia haemolytica]|uniref:BbrUII/HgiDII family restriction enzyme n=1 Tax=Mannheimia haemolytica TaxID=75985 RepID=UPI003AFB1822